jgi:hypothetical protein
LFKQGAQPGNLKSTSMREVVDDVQQVVNTKWFSQEQGIMREPAWMLSAASGG